MKDTIFVSIASYRDAICHTTLTSLYTNARHPLNVYVNRMMLEILTVLPTD